MSLKLGRHTGTQWHSSWEPEGEEGEEGGAVREPSVADLPWEEEEAKELTKLASRSRSSEERQYSFTSGWTRLRNKKVSILPRKRKKERKPDKFVLEEAKAEKSVRGCF